MKTLKAFTIDFGPIEQSMRDWCRDADDHYLNIMTGKVVVISKSLIRAMAMETEVDQDVLPEWEARLIPLARKIVVEGSTDYLRIPEAFGHPEREWMSKFAEEVHLDELKKKLIHALKGRGACKRFKEILKSYPEDEKRWSRFRSSCWKVKIQSWLESIGILAIETAPGRTAVH